MRWCSYFLNHRHFVSRTCLRTATPSCIIGSRGHVNNSTIEPNTHTHTQNMTTTMTLTTNAHTKVNWIGSWNSIEFDSLRFFTKRDQVIDDRHMPHTNTYYHTSTCNRNREMKPHKMMARISIHPKFRWAISRKCEKITNRNRKSEKQNTQRKTENVENRHRVKI